MKQDWFFVKWAVEEAKKYGRVPHNDMSHVDRILEYLGDDPFRKYETWELIGEGTPINRRIEEANRLYDLMIMRTNFNTDYSLAEEN